MVNGHVARSASAHPAGLLTHINLRGEPIAMIALWGIEFHSVAGAVSPACPTPALFHQRRAVSNGVRALVGTRAWREWVATFELAKRAALNHRDSLLSKLYRPRLSSPGDDSNLASEFISVQCFG